MKINVEKVKSMVLAFLVLFSLILTWGIWTFQPQYDFKQRAANTIPTVTIGEKRQFNDVIQPTQYIYHEDGLHYGITDYGLTDDIFKTIMDFNIEEYEQIDFSGKEKLSTLLSDRNSFEMIFPIRLPINIINYIMGPIRHDWELNYFDRIFVEFSEKQQSVYYISSSEDKAIKLLINDEQIKRVKEKVVTAQKRSLPYYSITAKQGQTLYLPESRVTLNQLTFSTQYINSTDVKNALFNDPNGVKQYSLNNGEESFTDGIRALEISKNSNSMRYINPANQEIYEMEPEELILKSIEFINDHSGWTDSFALMDWSKNNHNVQFRLLVNGHPVFQQNGQATISQSWRDNEIYEYARSLINLRFNIESEEKAVTLPSGRELLSYLAEIKPEFSLGLLENVLIGYDFSIESMNAEMATIQPNWFIKYDGQWEEIFIPDSVIDQGGSQFGLE